MDSIEIFVLFFVLCFEVGVRCEPSGIILTWSKRVQPKQMDKVNMLVLIMIVVNVVDCRDLLDKQEWVMAASGVCRHLLEELN